MLMGPIVESHGLLGRFLGTPAPQVVLGVMDPKRVRSMYLIPQGGR
jgi:hypothetical protein